MNDRSLIPGGSSTTAGVFYDKIISELGRMIALFGAASPEHGRLIVVFERQRQDYLTAVGRSQAGEATR
jgi:hypothetical protein